jgi:uncharacterized membrane protein
MGAMNLSETERLSIEARTARLEAHTGVQAVVAVVGRCDAYPEVPWKAFALCSGLAALATLPWHPDAMLGGSAFLLAGAAAALATLFVPAFARLFLDSARRETETRQYAASFFFDHDLSRTQRRNVILVLVGGFERTVVILPDAGLSPCLAAAELKAIIARMVPQLAAGRMAAALLDGLDALEALLATKRLAGGTGTKAIEGESEDEIEQEVFEEAGA